VGEKITPQPPEGGVFDEHILKPDSAKNRAFYFYYKQIREFPL
jgi:hypothetical protein